jgi:hypothetical protein
MTATEFKAKIAEAKTAEELRKLVDAFVPTFATLSNGEKNLIRKKWKGRQLELGVKV